MSVQGFNTGAGVERYDYNALDNKPVITNTRVKGDAESEYRTGNVNLTKANIGLGNVDNTSDANKPVSTAQQSALNGKVDKVEGKGLSTNDYTNADKNRVNNAVLQEDLDTVAPIIINTASGAIASFSDGADSMPIKSLVAQIEPVQDLHGYDHPWPAGGGKNLLPLDLATIKAASTAGTWSGNNYTINGVTFSVITDDGGNVDCISAVGTPTATAPIVLSRNAPIAAGSFVLSGAPSGGGSSAWEIAIVGKASDFGNGASFTTTSSSTNTIVIYIYSGNTVNLKFYPMIRLATETDATFEPYSNECPITGWTGLTGARTGKNVFPYNLDILKAANVAGVWSGNSYSYQGLTYTVGADDGGNVTQIGVSGTLTAADHFFYVGGRASSSRTHTMKSGRYIATGYSAPYMLRVGKGVQNKFIGNFNAGSTIELDGDVFEFGLRIQNASGQSVNTTLYPMLRLATDTDNTYEPPYSDTISVNWQDTAGTVYGGTPDVISGKMVADKAMVDLGTLEWYDAVLPNHPKRFRAHVTGIKRIDNPNTLVPLVCSAYPAKTANQTYSGILGISLQQNTNDVYIYDPEKESFSIADFKIAMNGVQLVYELAEPITYQLTPQEVTTLLGANNIWTDVGPVSVEYPADTKLYIDNKITQAIAAALNA